MKLLKRINKARNKGHWTHKLHKLVLKFNVKYYEMDILCQA